MTDDGSDDLYTPAQYREWQEGHGQRDADAHRHTALVRDERLSRYLSVIEMHYDPTAAAKPKEMPGQAKDLAEVRETVAMEATEAGRQAMEHGDMQSLKHQTGDMDHQADISGIKAIDALRDQMTGPAPMFYIWAEPGTGKSNFSCLIGQLWQGQQPSDAIVASNIRSLDETDYWSSEGEVVDPVTVVDDDGDPVDADPRDGWIANYGELNEWLKQDGNPRENEQRPKLFIFDEASSNAGGGGSDGYETKKKMGPLAYKIRKYGGSLVVIGHDGKDVHPLIRELGTAIHKHSLKEATFYEDVKNRDGQREIMSIAGIPETDWSYDDKEPTTWSWSDENQDDDDDDLTAKDMATVTAIRCKEQGMTGGEVSKFLPYSRAWVDSRYREYRDDGDHSDLLARFEEVIA